MHHFDQRVSSEEARMGWTRLLLQNTTIFWCWYIASESIYFKYFAYHLLLKNNNNNNNKIWCFRESMSPS